MFCAEWMYWHWCRRAARAPITDTGAPPLGRSPRRGCVRRAGALAEAAGRPGGTASRGRAGAKLCPRCSAVSCAWRSTSIAHPTRGRAASRPSARSIPRSPPGTGTTGPFLPASPQSKPPPPLPPAPRAAAGPWRGNRPVFPPGASPAPKSSTASTAGAEIRKIPSLDARIAPSGPSVTTVMQFPPDASISAAVAGSPLAELRGLDPVGDDEIDHADDTRHVPGDWARC